jgi:hypothetical protein
LIEDIFDADWSMSTSSVAPLADSFDVAFAADISLKVYKFARKTSSTTTLSHNATHRKRRTSNKSSAPRLTRAQRLAAVRDLSDTEFEKYYYGLAKLGLWPNREEDTRIAPLIVWAD